MLSNLIHLDMFGALTNVADDMSTVEHLFDIFVLHVVQKTFSQGTILEAHRLRDGAVKRDALHVSTFDLFCVILFLLETLCVWNI